jgi:murein DD-endopeptidase MepM/ murein hydrolase activator NlpD
LNTAGLRKGSLAALFFALFVLPVAASAQQAATQQPTVKQQTEEADAQTVVVPPAPVIIKKNPNSISIPAEDAKQETKFEQRAASSTYTPSNYPKIGSVYGYRRDPFTRRSRFHSGVDIKARWGDPVGASHPGTVQFAGWYYGYGNLIIVDHGGGVTTYYAHLSSFEVEVGDKVARGVIIGYAGSTGRATSPHLHYEVRVGGDPVNPLQPLALDPSSEYFKQSQPADETAAGDKAAPPQKQDH